ncbi:MAG: alpha-glucosidase C-terminal domain-containing protein [Candidatus Riflebacteria bacterium]|nr:alpha-glucosidase C-terminal domain-containing protein [Candidatus Riflebacteria bacterium]
MLEENSPLKKIKDSLIELSKKLQNIDYKVPSLWAPVGKKPENPSKIVKVNPVNFFIEHIEAIEKNALKNIQPLKSLNQQLKSEIAGKGGNWVTEGGIFNLFVRLATAFDHNSDGKTGQGDNDDPTLNSDGIRETGTFLKSIALLGHISSFGVKTIHLLPVTAIGHDGNKGVLGSPYAIRNPYKIENTLADPLVQSDVEEQFRAFIEAAHMLGIRVICEFVFRTASKDADWILEHPEWFYWIDSNISDRNPDEKDIQKLCKQYGNPIFADEVLKIINQKVSGNDFSNLPAPPAEYINFFKNPPSSDNVRLSNSGKITGKSYDDKLNKLVETRIPGAFADWPPDDTQPPWGDVTYLRMYRDENGKDPEFNYIAYNTIRMYDNRLAQSHLENIPLWEKIIGLVPYYQEKYGIDGVMVDMGHAVPVNLMRKIVDTARQKDPEFAFLSENFSIEESSIKAGYNAVVGYAWWVEYKREGMRDLLQHVGVRGIPLPFFGAVENHNTPRAAARNGGEKYAMYSFLTNTFLPGSVPFIHSGFELGETAPINTGLDFKPEDIEKLKNCPLSLFDIASLNWTGNSRMLAFTQLVMKKRNEHARLLSKLDTSTFYLFETGNEDVFAFLRHGNGKKILVIFNRDISSPQKATVDLGKFAENSGARLDNILKEFSGLTEIKLHEGKIDTVLPEASCHLFEW